MVGGHEAPAFLGVEVEGARRVEEADQFLAGTMGAPARDDERALCRPQRLHSSIDRVGMRRDLTGGLGRHPLVEDEGGRHVLAEHVRRDLDVDGAGFAEVAHRPRHRLVQFAHGLLRHAQRAGDAGHGAEDVGVGNVLQRPHVDLRAGRAAADDEDGRPCKGGVRNRRHGVGDAWARRHHGDGEVAREFGVGVRHVDGGTLVAGVDDLDAKPRRVVPDRLDVAALQAEDPLDPARLQEAGDPGGAGLLVGVEIGDVLSFAHGDQPFCASSASCALRRRCWIFPVAVRGMSSSRMNEQERGRL